MAPAVPHPSLRSPRRAAAAMRGPRPEEWLGIVHDPQIVSRAPFQRMHKPLGCERGGDDGAVNGGVGGRRCRLLCLHAP